MSKVYSRSDLSTSNTQQSDLLHSLLDALENRFVSNEQADRSFVSLLSSLASHLQMHFEWDECDVSFGGLEQRVPELAGDIVQLKNEQAQLLHDVDVLIGLARLAFAEKQDTKSLADRYRAFLSKFAKHEATEKRLLQTAFNSNPDLSE